MKNINIRYWTAAAILTLTSVACVKLDQTPLSSLPAENYFNSDAQLQSYVNNLYTPRTGSNSNDQTFDVHGTYNYGTFAIDNNTDNMAGKGNGDDRWILANNKVGQTGGDWSFSYIYKVNYFFRYALPKYEAGTISGSEANVKQAIGGNGYLTVENYDAKGDYQIFKLLQDAGNAARYNLEINSQYLTHDAVNAWDIVLGTSVGDPLAELVLTTNDAGQTRIAVVANADTKWVAPDKAGSPAGTQCYADKSHADIEWVLEPAKFRIKNVATGFYMTNLDGALKITTATATGEGQIFKIDKDESADDAAHINISVAGKYLTQHASNAWTVIFETNAAEPRAEWLMTGTAEATKFQALGFSGTAKFLAPQADDEASTIYADTEGSRGEWILEPTSGGGVVEIEALLPQDSSTGALPDDEITVAFNKPIAAKGDLSTITITNIGDNSLLAGVLGVIAGKVLTVTHTDPLVLKAAYRVDIPAGVISGYDDAISWTFTMASNPNSVAITALLPADGAVGVYLTAEVAVQFQKNIAYAAGLTGITIKDGSGNPVGGVLGTALYGKLTIAHDELAANTTYTVIVPENTLYDYPDEITWSFTTGTGGGSTGVAQAGSIGASVYPTFTSGSVSIAAPVPVSITVITTDGQALATYPAAYNTTLHLGYPQGIYLVVLQNGKSVEVHKVVVAK
ncbi:hypothetical protein FACS1894156_0140 [Bacteroidia bacterium]|nr:hypothetical protein FACS1894156_0140 [Bacteroidia bacterium]